MTNANTDMLATVSIANVIHSGAGFGVVIGTGANCIIPSRVLYAADLRVGDLIRCRLADNPSEEFRGRTPYMVSYVDPNATADLRRAITGRTTPHQAGAVAAQPTEQLNLPFEKPLKAMLEAWGGEDEEVMPAPTPAVTQVPVTPTLSIDWYASAKAALKKLGGVATSAEIADECGCATQHISTYLRTLHDRGDICRAGIRTSSKQTKDSLVYWGLTLDGLLPAGMVEEDEA